MCSHPIAGGLLLAGLLAAASSAAASGLQVAPTGLQLVPGGPAQGLWLTNTGDRELRAQVRAYSWSQRGGKDELEATQALIASPPMLSIAAGGRQLVRVIRTGQGATAAGEQAFRLLIDELPQGGAPTTGVQYVLRYSIPVFVGAADARVDPAALQWSSTVESDQLQIEIRNTGSSHAQIAGITLVPGDGAATELVPGLLGYVLPGSTMHWTVGLPTDVNTANARVKALINGEPTDQTLSTGSHAR
jgi:fimbrial chaperone protein